MTYRWTLRPLDDEALVAQIAHDLNALPEPLARALVLRGVDSLDTARRFFRDELPAAHDPFLMRDMDRAADRLAEAIAQGERILVYGDYDVDGTTATATMTAFLRAQGADVSYFIPNRFEHGYGLGEAGLNEAASRGAALVVALDCGITAVEEARYAKSIGLDLIIGDHHEPGPELPEAVAVLDPKRPDCRYPFRGLSGCGVGFKLIQATLQRLGRPPEEAYAFLDLLAVSIAADIVPIIDENRVLMRTGLQRLASEPRLGLRALAEVANADLSNADVSAIVFRLGPRINAAGRLGDAGRAVELFLAEDAGEARRLAAELDALNRERQGLDAATHTEAIAQAKALMADDPFALVLHGEDWHPGVIGIVASRIAERFFRPTILLTGRGPVIKGSARSISGVSIYQALSACAPHITGFGGHDAAAGVSLDVAQLDAFRRALHEAIGGVVELEQLQPEITLDASLHLGDLQDGLRGRFWSVLRQFGPFGPDNPRPVFWGRGLRVVQEPRTVGADGKHLKLMVQQEEGAPAFPVIGFGLGDRLPLAQRSVRAGVPLEMAFCLDENRWRGNTELQLEAKDLREETGEG